MQFGKSGKKYMGDRYTRGGGPALPPLGGLPGPKNSYPALPLYSGRFALYSQQCTNT